MNRKSIELLKKEDLSFYIFLIRIMLLLLSTLALFNFGCVPIFQMKFGKCLLLCFLSIHECTLEEEAELAARCEAAVSLLEDQQCMMVAVRGELRAGRARASALGRSLREEERSFLEELKRRSHKITLLNRELQHQNVVTMSLCNELQSARLKLFRQRHSAETAGEEEEEEARGNEEVEEDEGDDNEDESSLWLFSPPPPASPHLSEASQKGRVSSVREERVRACVPRERVTSPQRPHPMPDPALFLVPLRYRLLRFNQPIRTQDGDGLEDEWEDIEDIGVPRRVDMGAGEGETAL